MHAEEAEDVLRFWFPDLSAADGPRIVRQFQWWFQGGADSVIVDRFAPLVERAARGELDPWSASPRTRLALIVVLDQFPRSLYRGTARAFAQDSRALGLALEGIGNGHFDALATPWEKTFFSMPLEHSEELSHQQRSVALAEQLALESPPHLRRILEHCASQACGHRDVIVRFGRHPHRNVALGRQSTLEELDYLAIGELVHTRPIPES